MFLYEHGKLGEQHTLVWLLFQCSSVPVSDLAAGQLVLASGALELGGVVGTGVRPKAATSGDDERRLSRRMLKFLYLCT